VRTELTNYKKMLMIVDEEIKDLAKVVKKDVPISSKNQAKDKEYISLEKITPNGIAILLKNEHGKIIWNSSIG
ncbi:MAG: hypothetical protein PF445_01105, partial [Melioribacteraceae bacterium]|nr:hypothetical protein [Melioribacteraceae bacterium]